MRRIAWTSVLLALTTGLTLGLTSPSASANDRTPPPPPQALRHRGTFLTDDRGRVVMIHGVNAVYKHHPYVLRPTHSGFTKRRREVHSSGTASTPSASVSSSPA